MSEVCVTTHNVAGLTTSNILGRITAIENGTKLRNNIETSEIAFFQELAFSKDVYDIIDKDCIVRQHSWTNKDDAGKNVPFFKKMGTTCNAVVYDRTRFEKVDVIPVKYIDDDNEHINQGKNLGCRSTNWIVLRDTHSPQGKRNYYCVMSLHGNSGPKNDKRDRLVDSILAQADSFPRSYRVIIGGDFNMDIQSIDSLVDRHTRVMSPRDYNADVAKHTHYNHENGFCARLDWILFDVKFRNVSIRESIGDIYNKNRKNPSDHECVISFLAPF